MEEQLLKDPDVDFNDAYLEKETGKLYPVLKVFLDEVSSEAFGCNPEWRYYKDGKAWLCKVTRKKKTVIWMSVWKDCLKTALYFTEKTGAGIEDLDIDESLKTIYREHKPIGRLKPVICEVSRKSQLKDVYVLMRYKAGIKV
jgi:hypothetical protein